MLETCPHCGNQYMPRPGQGGCPRCEAATDRGDDGWDDLDDGWGEGLAGEPGSPGEPAEEGRTGSSEDVSGEREPGAIVPRGGVEEEAPAPTSAWPSEPEAAVMVSEEYASEVPVQTLVRPPGYELEYDEDEEDEEEIPTSVTRPRPKRTRAKGKRRAGRAARGAVAPAERADPDDTLRMRKPRRPQVPARRPDRPRATRKASRPWFVPLLVLMVALVVAFLALWAASSK